MPQILRGNHLLQRATEELHEHAIGLDQRPAKDIARLLAKTQGVAATSVNSALSPICEGASAMARTIRQGGELHFLAAGSSGLMAASDALELGGTFSIPSAQIRIHMAGGMPSGVEMPGGTEDDTADLYDALGSLTSQDTVIAVSASGSTPYTIAGCEIARARNATILGIANNAGAPLFALSDHAILLETPPELISGSTRMGAGTAQKIALNMLSTLMAIELGHVHDGMMVNVRADNAKLRQRAAGIVASIADVPEATATKALKLTEGEVKSAVLAAAGNLAFDRAKSMLAETKGHLRPALERLNYKNQQPGGSQ